MFRLGRHSLVDSYLCPDLGSNPQPWRIGMTLQPAELPSQCLQTSLLNLLFFKDQDSVFRFREAGLLGCSAWKRHSFVMRGSV